VLGGGPAHRVLELEPLEQGAFRVEREPGAVEVDRRVT
jgi:hypothetical protein